MAKRNVNLKIFIPTFIVGLFLVVLLAFELAYQNRIYPGVVVAGVRMGNKTREEAKRALQEKVNLNSPRKLILFTANKTWEEDLTLLGLSYNIEESVEAAYQVGRKGNPLLSWQEKKTAWFNQINLALIYQLNQSLLEEKIREITNALFVPAVNPQIKVLEKRLTGSQTRIMVEPGKAGQEVDREALRRVIASQLSHLKSEPISLPISKTNPQLTEIELELAKIRAEKFLNKNLKLSFEDKIFTLPEKELIDFITPSGGYNLEKINNFVQNLANSLNRPPQNAAFKFEAGRVTVFRPARPGITLREEKTAQQLLKSLEKLEKEEEKGATFPLVVSKLPPQIQTEEVNNLGIKELLGKGVSYFRGSISSRIHNIVLASSRLNGILVAPGETFSFNQNLGEVSQVTGFKEAYIIKEGRTILGDGGGVCQVSTTLFRAVLAAGLPVAERQAHAYRVSYYEQGFPPGLDATVFAPTVDFKFKNDTPAYILIQTAVDTKSKTLVFELYGTSDGRLVSLGKSRIWDQVPPPPDLYQDDPTLPAGTIKQIDWKAWGAKVAFDWRVQRGGEVLEERTFYSTYRPWQAVYLRGTGIPQ